MSSMLRQHHVKIQDLVTYLRGYDPAKPQTAEDWSKQESSGFEPGMLIFCLERVSAPSGLAFGKKDAEGETYRVKDLCVVVGRDNNRSLVVNITASAFELRYLEVLMLEKARKAILDGKDFLYVAVKPAQPLAEAKLREIEELGAMYAQGGSRRSLVVDASGPQEPAVALLAALGVKLSIGGIGKQVLDIGSICHMLFAPEGRQEDKNKSIVKSCFTAIPNNEPVGNGGQTSAFTPQSQGQPGQQQRIRPASPPPPAPQDWSAPQSGWAQDLQTPESSSTSLPTFGYDKNVEAPPSPQSFGYEQPSGGLPGEPTPWAQPSPATGSFGLSGLNPFAPPSESGQDVGQFEHTDLVPPDFASQFKDDLANGLAGESAFRFEGQAASSGENSWSVDASEQFPPSTVFSEQQFNNDHFQTPDFSQSVDIGAGSSELTAPPQEVFTTFTPATPSVVPAVGTTSEDVFQPPYEGATSTGEFQLPAELTAKLDPQNQLFQMSDESESASPAVAQDVPEVNFGFDAFNQQPPSEFVDSVFDTTSGAFEKTSRAMSFDDEPASASPTSSFTGLPASGIGSPTASFTGLPATPLGSPSASSTNLPATGSPTASSTNLPAQESWAMPASDWAQPAPPATDWGVDRKNEEPMSWKPEPAPAGWAQETPASEPAQTSWAQEAAPSEPAQANWAQEPATSELSSGNWAQKPSPAEAASGNWAQELPTNQSAPTWNFEGASQAPAWTPEPKVEPTTSSASWNPVLKADPNESAGISSTSWTAVPEAKSQPPEVTPASEPSQISEAQDDDDEPSDGAPSLFERLNQQLQKGSLSEIEPPPVAPLIPASEPEPAPPIRSATPAEKLGEVTLNLKADTSTEKTEERLTEPAATSEIKSEYADTPLPEPVAPAAPLPVPDPLPLGVSKKNAPLILDWPSSPPTDAGDTADNLPAVAASMSQPGAVVPPQATGAGDGIKHLAEALSGLMGDEGESRPPSPFANIRPPVRETQTPSEQVSPSLDAGAPSAETVQSVPDAESVETESRLATEKAAEVTAGADTQNKAAQNEDAARAQQAAVVDQAAAQDAEATSAAVADVTTAAAVQQESPAEVPLEEEIEEEEELSPSAALAAKGFQEPRLVMNEMASLMSKLEIQVQKAAKKLNTRAEEIRQRLLAQVDSLVADATQVEKESQRSTTNLSQRLIKSLDDVCEESRLKVSDVAANGRYTIKQLLTANQTTVDETKTTLYESLREACKQFRIETEALARTAENDLNELVSARTDELEKLVKAMSTHLDDTNSGFIEKLNARFERFKDRMSEEASSVVRSLERNVHSMVEEIDGSWDRASDKLKSSKSEFEQTIQHSVKTAELNLSQSTRLILTNALIPKLRERQQVLRMTASELGKRFSDESERQVSGQILGLEASLGAARQQLQTLVDECMSSIDSVGRGQQAGLEEIFKETSAHAERATTEVTEFLTKIEAQINDNEQTCKRLVENSSLDNDPEFTSERTSATQRVQQLRQQANSDLTAAIDQGCAKLEQLSNNIQQEVSAMRVEHTQAVRDAAENGLTRVRDAIQEAFNAIQAAREKYME